MTKIKGWLWLGVAATVGVIFLTSLDTGDVPSYRATPRSHTPPHVYAVDDKRPRVIRFYAAWDVPHTPARIMYRVGNAKPVLLYDYQLPGQMGHWKIEVAYDPHATYVLEVYQTSQYAEATDCELSVIDPGGFGFSDHERVSGSGTAHCWVNAAS